MQIWVAPLKSLRVGSKIYDFKLYLILKNMDNKNHVKKLEGWSQLNTKYLLLIAKTVHKLKARQFLDEYYTVFFRIISCSDNIPLSTYIILNQKISLCANILGKTFKMLVSLGKWKVKMLC